MASQALPHAKANIVAFHALLPGVMSLPLALLAVSQDALFVCFIYITTLVF